MFLSLQFLTFFLAALLFKRKFSASLWREALVFSFLSLGAAVLLSTEILSIFRLFSFWPLFFLWGAVVAVLFFLNANGMRTGKILNKMPFDVPLTLTEGVLVKCILILIVLLGLIALTTPPNTWDAMTYHMARVAHWVQNKTVAFYPTNIQRQLYLNPFAEYWIAQFVILSGGGDQWANMVQWISMLGTLVGMTLICHVLGINRLGQILSAFFVVTLPNAIVQATSTQTDFVETMWVITAVYFMLKNIKSISMVNTLAISIAVVLACYTKGTCLFILLPFWAWGLKVNFKGHLWCHSLVIFLCLIGTTLFLLLKNYWGLGACVFYGDRNHLLALNDLQGIISSCILHSFMHLRTGFVLTDQALGNFVDYLHHCLGTSIIQSSANFNVLPFNYMPFPFAEDEAPNFVFYLTFLVALIIFYFCRSWVGMSLKSKYFLMAVFCFFIFNTLVKWTPFDGRYQLAFFVLLTPLLVDVFLGYRKMLAFIIAVFLLSAAVFVITNQSKPLDGRSSLFKIPREYKYFYNRPSSLTTTMVITQAIVQSGCHQVGLDIGEDTWEYPYWVFLKDKVAPLRIEHILVNNSSKNLPYPLGNFLPCEIVSTGNATAMHYAGNTYVKDGSVIDVSLYNLMKTPQ